METGKGSPFGRGARPLMDFSLAAELGQMAYGRSRGQRRIPCVFPPTSVGVSELTLERSISCVNVTCRLYGRVVINR